MRIVSLVPSATETLLAWGVEPVAVTRFCEQPDLPQVGGTKDPDLVAIIGLEPDLVVLCEEENRRPDGEALVAAGLSVHVLRIDSVADVGPQLDGLAVAVGAAPPEPIELPDPGPPTSDDVGRGPYPSAFVPIWRRPWMTMSGGCYGSSLLAAIGIGNVLAQDPVRYPTTTLEDAAARHPALVVAPSEPYPFAERHVRELQAVAPVELVDGQDLFWWGVRTPAAMARLRGRLADWAIRA
jgi:ABC-type Fe3+-hydroxamate transport system substrate-binding protein